jgi:hypothetical protein
MALAVNLSRGVALDDVDEGDHGAQGLRQVRGDRQDCFSQ